MLKTNVNQKERLKTINPNFSKNHLSLLNNSNIINTSKLLPNINLKTQSNTTRKILSSIIYTNKSNPEKKKYK